MTRTRLYLCLAFGLVATLALACGGGGADKLAEALKSVTNDQLAIMVLPQKELGNDAADLPLAPGESGFMDNDSAADSTFDLNDTGADLAKAGRLNGYDLSYSDFSRFGGEGGALEVATSLDLFTDNDAASKFIAKQIDDLKSLQGQSPSEGFTIPEVATSRVDGLADEAIGGWYRFDVQDEGSGRATFVAFRLGRLVGAAISIRADDKNVDLQVATTARALERRISSILLGEITGTPVPLEEPSPQ